MKNIAILDVKQGDRNVANSITVAYRNLLELQRILSADLFVNVKDINMSKKYDVIICGFGSTSTERHKSTEFIDHNKDAELYWLVGEYEQSTFAPLFYCGREFNIIKNFTHTISNKKCKEQIFLDFNALLYRAPNRVTGKSYGPIYYGRWRDGRSAYFKKYLQDGVYLSTSTKNMKKFKRAGCNPSYIRSMKWNYKKEALNNFKYSIYIEDEFTHDHYNCLANRFYESLFCNVVQFFDSSCSNTIEQSGLDVDPFFIINDHKELMDKVKSSTYDSLLKKQIIWNDFAKDKKMDLVNGLLELF